MQFAGEHSESLGWIQFGKVSEMWGGGCQPREGLVDDRQTKQVWRDVAVDVGLYECTNCKKKFRSIIGKKKITIKGLVQRLSALEEKIMESAKKRAELEEQVKSLEEEKASLLAEIEALKALPELEAKISALEPEIAKLKEEKKALEKKAIPPSPPLPPAEDKPAEVAAAEAPAPAEEKPSE